MTGEQRESPAQVQGTNQDPSEAPNDSYMVGSESLRLSDLRCNQSQEYSDAEGCG